MRPAIDLNSDLGESFGAWRVGDDEAMFGIVSSANVACGFHAGDAITMAESVGRAVRHGVALGAHPGYRDLAGFGRRALDTSPAEIAAELLVQLGALDGVARGGGIRVRYVKAHGALYHRLAADERAAQAFVEAVARYDPTLPVLGPPASEPSAMYPRSTNASRAKRRPAASAARSSSLSGGPSTGSVGS